MTYSNATFYVDFENGSDTARTALTSVTTANNGSGLVRCTKTAHGLVTGAVVDNTINYTGAWIITVIDANTFDLVGSTFSSSVSLTATPRGGSSKADAWKTLNSGATSSRIAAGDTIRMMASTDETLVGNATWTNVSKTITLAGAVTANIDDGETAWTASANVTSTADTSQFKENTKSSKHVIATAFTTGLAAFKATGALDLSAYQQVSFWIFNTASFAASTLSLRLCSDTAGVTTVNTIAIPAVPSSNQWVSFTVDTGGALGASIQSVALYCDLDPGSITIQLDNIIACKASSSADSLSLTSLIGKVHNKVWVASTAYATNDIRKPTQPNRNGYRFKVTAGGGGNSGSTEPTWPGAIGATVTDGALTWTCEGLEDTWYGIQSINGTTVKLDNHVNNLGSAGRGYHGSTETVATYKREAIKLQTISTTSISNSYTDAQVSGTTGNHITYTGGWNRTDMTTQTGETWLNGQNGFGYVFGTNNKTYLTLQNLNGARFYTGAQGLGTPNVVKISNCHFNNMTIQPIYLNSATTIFIGKGIVCNNNLLSGTTGAIAINDNVQSQISASSFCSNLSGPGISTASSYGAQTTLTDIVCKNNATYGVLFSSQATLKATGLVTSNNDTAAVNCINGGAVFTNCSFAEATVFSSQTAFRDYYLYSQKHNQTTDNHLNTTDGGTIISATDQRHTASGISWKFRPTSTNRAALYPLRLSVAKLYCQANVAVSVRIWTYRDNTNIQGQLYLPAGQLNGVPETTVSCAPTINTWTQSSPLVFTPTETGVLEIFFLVWDGVGTTNNFWIDDLTVAS